MIAELKCFLRAHFWVACFLTAFVTSRAFSEGERVFRYGPNAYGFWGIGDVVDKTPFCLAMGKNKIGFLSNHGPNPAAFEAVFNGSFKNSTLPFFQASCGAASGRRGADGFLTSARIGNDRAVIGTKPGYYLGLNTAVDPKDSYSDVVTVGVYRHEKKGFLGFGKKPAELVHPSEGLAVYRNGKMTSTKITKFERLISGVHIEVPEGLLAGSASAPETLGSGGLTGKAGSAAPAVLECLPELAWAGALLAYRFVPESEKQAAFNSDDPFLPALVCTADLLSSIGDLEAIERFSYGPEGTRLRMITGKETNWRKLRGPPATSVLYSGDKTWGRQTNPYTMEGPARETGAEWKARKDRETEEYWEREKRSKQRAADREWLEERTGKFLPAGRVWPWSPHSGVGEWLTTPTSPGWRW